MSGKDSTGLTELRQRVLHRCPCGDLLAADAPLVVATESATLSVAIAARAFARVVCPRCQRAAGIDVPVAVLDDGRGRAALWLPESARQRELDAVIAFLDELRRTRAPYPAYLLAPTVCYGFADLERWLAGGGPAETLAAAVSAVIEAAPPIEALRPLSLPTPQPAPQPLAPLPLSPPTVAQPVAPPSDPFAAPRALFAALGAPVTPAPGLAPGGSTDRTPKIDAAEAEADEADEPHTAIRVSPVATTPGDKFLQSGLPSALYQQGEDAVFCAEAPLPPVGASLEVRVDLVKLPTYPVLLCTVGPQPVRLGSAGLFRVCLDVADEDHTLAIELLETNAAGRVELYDADRRHQRSTRVMLRPGTKLSDLAREARLVRERIGLAQRSFERACAVLALANGREPEAEVQTRQRADTIPVPTPPQMMGAPAPQTTWRRLRPEELPTASLEHVVKMLDDSEFRVEAALQLCERREASVVPALFEALRRMPRLEASRVLPAATTFGVAAEAELVTCVRSKKAYLRQGAALALGQLRTPRSVDALVQALLDEPTEIWGEIARALGDAGAQAVMPLGARLRAASAEQRERIVKALAHIAAGGVRGPVEMLGTSRDGLVAESAKRAIALVPEVRRQDAEVRQGTSEHTVVRGFSHRFYEQLDSEVELGDDEVEIAEDSGARRVQAPQTAQPGRRATTAKNLGAIVQQPQIDDLFDRSRGARGATAAKRGPAGESEPDSDSGDDDPPRSRRGTLPRGVS